MEKKKLELKDPYRRYSPRLKTTTSDCTTLTDQEKPCQMDTDREIHISHVPSPAANVSIVTEPKTPDTMLCRSRASTPSSSSAQRELKKIEDYWTRQNPVISNSPRLRYQKRKDHTNENTETARTHEKTDTNNSVEGAHKTQTEIECLPESPIPEYSVNMIETSSFQSCNVNDATLLRKDTSPKSDENVIEKKPTNDTIKENDGEYLPPRKKLRSEVKQDELWEGIPLTVSFKRLTPLFKRTAISSQLNGYQTIDMYEEESKQKHERIPFDNLDLDSRLIKPHNDGNVGKNNELKHRNLFDQLKQPVLKMTRIQTIVSPNVKRSARLQQKNNTTPTKYNTTSPENNTASTKTKTNPTSTNTTPSKNNTTPTKNNTTPTKNNTTSTRNNTTPTKNNTTPTKNNTTSTKNNTTPTKNNTSPTKNNTTSTKNNTTQIKNNTTQIKNNATPSKNNTTATKKNTTTTKNITRQTKFSGKTKTVNNGFSSSLCSSDTVRFDKAANNKIETASKSEELNHDCQRQLLEQPSNASNHSDEILSPSLENPTASLKKMQDADSIEYQTIDISDMSISQILLCDSQNSLSENVPEVADTVEIGLDTSNIQEQEDDSKKDDGTYISENSTSSRCQSVLEIIETVCTSSVDETVDINTNIECDKETYQTGQSVEQYETTENVESFTSGKEKPRLRRLSDAAECITDTKGEHRIRCGRKLPNGKSSFLYTQIKESKANKKGKVPPLKIKLKNTSKRSKCWKIKTNENEKTSAGKPTAIKDSEEDILDSNEPSSPGSLKDETSKINQLTQKSGGKKKRTKKTFQDIKPESKITKKKKRHTRKCSPPSNVNLRLNSERRISMANGLLSNKLLNNHACVIWSSENRRHMHLSNPNATAAELDDLLRDKWTQLCEKEKIRYFQRAWDASKDENRHAGRRNEKFEEQERKPGNPSIERFMAMDSKRQHEEIKHWLQFYYKVSVEAYNDVIDQFRASLQAEKLEHEQAEKESKSRSKAKKYKKKKYKQTLPEPDTDSKHKRLMFEAILNNRQDIIETWAEKKETQAQQLRDDFDNLIQTLVAGEDEDVELTRTVKSVKLTEVLLDLRALEKDRKLMVSGETNDDATYDTLLNEVDEYFKEKNKPLSMLDSLTDSCVNHDKVEEYLRVTNKLDEHKMPILNAVAIKHVLDDFTNSSKRRKNFSIYKKPTTLSPPSMLTQWVADDIVRATPNVGYRNAVSLLSNKIHTSPAFFNSKLKDKTKVSSSSASNRKMHSILTANTNQNCYKTVTYTFARDKSSTPIISKLKQMQSGL